MAIGPRGDILPPAVHRVPREWQHLVCLCGTDHGTKHELDTMGIYMLCRKCGKYKRFYCSNCANCKQFYLIVFHHPMWTPSKNWCYNCLLTLGPVHPKSVPPLDIVKPQVVKSQAELGAELDTFFSDVVDLTDSVDFDF